MLPDYILNDEELQSLPDKDEIVERHKTIDDEKIAKQILMAVYVNAIQELMFFPTSHIYYSKLRNLSFQPLLHLNLIVDFIRSKGFEVKVDYDSLVISIPDDIRLGLLKGDNL